MRAKPQYDIITGLKKINSDRTTQSEQRLPKLNSFSNRVYHLPSLGVPRDSKSFRYAYGDGGSVNKISNKSVIEKKQKTTTLNYTNQEYDFINHRDTNPNCPKIQHEEFTDRFSLAYKKGMLTKHIDKARLYSPNFHQGFGDKVQNHEFHRKKQLCGETANIEKSYMNRYFRKYK